jgi:U4/U6 small nuclear ribonucleoprotein PRP31
VSTKKQQTKSYSGVSSTVSGLASSVVFTPVKGFEINNQNIASQQEKVKEANLKYFSNAAGFLKVGKKQDDK